MYQTDFFSFLNELPVPSFVINKNLEIIFATTRFETLLGFDSGALSGLTLQKLLFGELSVAGLNKTLNESVQAVNNGFNKTFDLKLKSASQDKVLVQLMASLIELEDFQGWLLTLSDTKDSNRQKLESAAQSALSAWNIGVFYEDHLTGEVFTSDEFEQLLALDPGEKLTSEKLSEKVLPSEIEMIEKAIDKAYDPAGDGVFDVVHQFKTKNDKIIWVHSRCKTYFSMDKGERIPAYTMGTIRNVDEQRKLDLELARNQERLTQVIEVAQVGIFEHDHLESPTGGKLYWSPHFRKMLGVDEDHVASMVWYDSLIVPEDLKLVQAALMKTFDINGDGYFEVEHRWLHPDGKIRWFFLRGKTFFKNIDGHKLPFLTVGAAIDVTERKVIEEDIRKRTAILESTPDFVGITDLRGNLVYLNQGGRDFVGVGADDDITGINMSSLHTDESTKIILDEGISCAINAGSWKSESEFINHDGKIFPMSLIILAHKDSAGDVAYFSVVARDLSREKTLEEQFYQAQKMESIGRLAGGIAHDFNNMLSVIMGFTSLAADELNPHHESQTHLDQVLKASQKAAALTEHLLAFGRKQIMQLVVVDVNEIIAGMTLMIGTLVDDHIVVDIHLSDYPCCVKADPNQIEQMLLNLIVNARDSMPKGGKLIIETQKVTFQGEQVSDRLDLYPGTYILIAVSDSGDGMDAETVKKVFDPFFTTKELHQGTGLGLATVYGIVKQSGGTIWVYSEPGHGTVFKTYFPCTDEALVAPIHLPDEVLNEPGGVVLLTEDEPQVRAVVIAVLENVGYTVLSASDGEEALRIAENYDGLIDLLLTDVVMPRMSGKELALKLLEKRPEIQVLYISGYTENSIVHHGVLDEEVNFLAKPLMPSKLVKKVGQLLSK